MTDSLPEHPIQKTFAAIRFWAVPRLTDWLVGSCIVLALVHQASFAQEPDQKPAIPSFAELEAAGAVIGQIRIDTQNIFDLNDPEENNFLFRLANKLHIETRPSVIARTLLFKSGDLVSVRVIEESERLLRTNNYLYDVSIRPVAYHDGVVDIDVTTRDTWTLEPGIRFSREGGANTFGTTIRERNAFGTGVSLGLSRKSDVDRTTTEFEIAQPHAFDGWTSINYAYADLEDGESQSFGLVRPFYALDTRWAAGVSAAQDSRVDSIFGGGETLGQYRHKQESGAVFGGWSNGLIDGWTHRKSIGLNYQADTYAVEPGLKPPPQLPADQTLVTPFFRYEVVQDNFELLKNRDLIERPEYFALGFSASVQLGRAMTELGSTRDLWQYSANISEGFIVFSDHDVLLGAGVSGQYVDGRVERQSLSGSAKYYAPTSKRAVFFASIAGTTLTNPDVPDQLVLGGDTGLRGYPLRYQVGEHLVVATVEQRVFTDWYPFRLFRIGGAIFYDMGRAWGGDNPNTVNPGWLSDVGFGLRVLSARAAFGRVFHIDFAFPLNADPSINSFQVLVKSKVSF